MLSAMQVKVKRSSNCSKKLWSSFIPKLQSLLVSRRSEPWQCWVCRFQTFQTPEEWLGAFLLVSRHIPPQLRGAAIPCPGLQECKMIKGRANNFFDLMEEQITRYLWVEHSLNRRKSELSDSSLNRE
jgi:hypothetical protein